MRVIATAGHVDHGKSTLVRALTGIEPDRLAEEQARQLTIDLGFAWLHMPDGETVGIIDVPGHEDFIENMLAGVGGIDAGMLIIAADEGVMPQTREHLAILSLLQVPRLLVALTKTDLIEDPEWLELVMLDIDEVLEQAGFVNVPIMPVSAARGDGLDALVETLHDLLDSLQPQPEDGIPRLPVDRVFTLSGFGTVVTGTLLDGPLEVGDIIEIVPQQLQARIRNLQSHNQDVQQALPGSRVAVNLAGVEKDAIQRGDVLTWPDHIHPTTLIDASLTYLPAASRPLQHNAEVKIFVGPSETTGRIRLLFNDALVPESESYVQIQLDQSLPLLNGQRYIIRYLSPPETIGGGTVLDTAPGRKWKRQRDEVFARFERLTRGTPVDLIAEALIQARRPMSFSELEKKSGLSVQDFALPPEIVSSEGWLTHTETLNYYAERIQSLLEQYQRANPLHRGMPLQRLANRLRLDEAYLQHILSLIPKAAQVSSGKFIHLPGFEVRYTKAQQAGIKKLEAALTSHPYTPPSVKEAIEMVGDSSVIDALISQGILVRLGSDVLLAPDVYQEWLVWTDQQLSQSGEVRLAEMRDAFNTSRKYILAFLDHLESQHLTRRSGEAHQRGRADWSTVI